MREKQAGLLQTILDFLVDSFPWLFLTFIFLLLLSPSKETAVQPVEAPVCETKVVEKVVYREKEVQKEESTCEKRLNRYYKLNLEPPEWLVRGCTR